jgi:type VI protein secretion system component VasK
MSQYQAQVEGLTLPVAEAGHHLNQTDFGSLLQEQLARLRRSWNHEIQQPPAPPATHHLLQSLSNLGTNSSELHFLFATLFTHPKAPARCRDLSG